MFPNFQCSPKELQEFTITQNSTTNQNSYSVLNKLRSVHFVLTRSNLSRKFIDDWMISVSKGIIGIRRFPVGIKRFTVMNNISVPTVLDMPAEVLPTADESHIRGRRSDVAANMTITGTSTSKLYTLEQFINSSSDGNSFREELIAENTGGKLSQFQCRQVKDAHYSDTCPEKVPNPAMLCYSNSCAIDLGLSPEEMKRDLFLKVFSGGMEFNPPNPNLEGFNRPYSTVYGCHSYGQWFGQLGDGRAVMLGEVEAPLLPPENRDQSSSSSEAMPRKAKEGDSLQVVCKQHKYVVQLKGSGRTPYSRHGDGRAVLRSSVREFFASESMHFLGVPTTRALCVMTTGQLVGRRWYKQQTSDFVATEGLNENGTTPAKAEVLRQAQEARMKAEVEMEDTSDWTVEERYAHKYPPQSVFREHGAVLTRISPCTMVRIAQLELFAKREDPKCALQLADYVIKHEYPEILEEDGEDSDVDGGDAHAFTSDGLQMQDAVLQLSVAAAKRYIRLYEHVAARCAYLVAQWMRVGYVQGNMNADNILIGGKTIDYGPFGMMEEYEPSFQPFTSDDDGHFSFSQQPVAMLVNIYTLSTTIEFLVDSTVKDPAIVAKLKDSITHVHERYFQECFGTYFAAVEYDKLGILSEPELLESVEPQILAKQLISPLFTDLLKLMREHRCDYTVMFRNSSEIARLLIESAIADICSTEGGNDGASVLQMLEVIAYGSNTAGIPVSDAVINACLDLVRTSTHTAGKIKDVDSATSREGTEKVVETPWANWLRRYSHVLLMDTVVQVQLAAATAENSSTVDSSYSTCSSDSIGSIITRRQALQNGTNPKYIMRNYMMAAVYEEFNRLHTAASQNTSSNNAGANTSPTKPYDIDDPRLLWHEIMACVENPYDLPSLRKNSDLTARAEKYFCKSPVWARDLPGLAFMS